MTKKNTWSAKSRGKKTGKSSKKKPLAQPVLSVPTIEVRSLMGLLVDLWRIQKRAEREGAPEPVLMALERAMDRVHGLGFEIKTLEGEIYETHLKVEVIDDRGGQSPKRILECLTPAVYFRGKLIEWARVIIGGQDNGKTDS